MLLVIETDRCDGRDNRLEHVGSVEPPAKSHLTHRDLDPMSPEQLERNGGRGLEERRVDAEYAAVVQTVDHGLKMRNRAGKRVAVDDASVDDKPLRQTNEMRRGVASRTMHRGP